MQPTFSYNMKIQNRLVVYRTILATPGQSVTRTDISRRTGISGPTILKIFEFLENHGFIAECGALATSEPGRKSSIFRFIPDSACAVGVSYDGQTVDFSLVDLNCRTMKHESIRLHTDVSSLIGKELPAFLPGFISGCRRPLGIGISLPASVDDKARRIRYQALPALKGRIAREDLSRECLMLEQSMGLPVLLENDVNCAAVAIYISTMHTGKEDLIYVMLGGGLGAGMILDGRLRRGSHLTCGEIGYMVSDPGYSARLGSGYLENQIYSKTQIKFGVDLLNDSSYPLSHEAVCYIADELGLAVASIANAMDVSLFIIGGHVAEQCGSALIEAMKARLDTLCVHSIKLTADTSPDSFARGAAALLIYRELDNLLAD